MKYFVELLVLIIVGGLIGLTIPSPFSFVVSFMAGGTIGVMWNDIWDKLNNWLRKY